MVLGLEGWRWAWKEGAFAAGHRDELRMTPDFGQTNMASRRCPCLKRVPGGVLLCIATASGSPVGEVWMPAKT
jgi:hypothetical protein